MKMNQFKRAQVIMLPTEDITSFYKWGARLYHNCLKKSHVNTKSDSQHLYIISDDEIKENDFILTFTHAYGYKVDQIKDICKETYVSVRNELLPEGLIKGKIISTTYSSLKLRTDVPEYWSNSLPQPSQQFIEKYIEEYNKGNVIKDVLVEYDNFISKNGCNLNDGYYSDLKINLKDNTIAIKKLKDSWNRKEVIEQMWSAYKAANTLFEDESALRIEFNNWIDQNI